MSFILCTFVDQSQFFRSLTAVTSSILDAFYSSPVRAITMLSHLALTLSINVLGTSGNIFSVPAVLEDDLIFEL